MNGDDENEKSRQAANYLILQERAKEFQNKFNDLQNKEYQGKYQGLTIKIKGDFQVLNVKIEQSFYETAGKSQIEKAIMSLMNNLKRAITDEQKALQDEFQREFDQIRRDAQINGTY